MADSLAVSSSHAQVEAGKKDEEGEEQAAGQDGDGGVVMLKSRCSWSRLAAACTMQVGADDAGGAPGAARVCNSEAAIPGLLRADSAGDDRVVGFMGPGN